MILGASSRTDIPAYYLPWFFNRLKAGFFDVRNPFFPRKVSRIQTRYIDAIMFCTKNPLHLVDCIDQIPFPVLLDVTITPYHAEMEPGVPDKNRVIDAVEKISEQIGADRVTVRYDPIFLTERYTVDYHLRAFRQLCRRLQGKISDITISLLDDYKNVRKNQKECCFRLPEPEELRLLGEGIKKISDEYRIPVFTCHEKGILEPYGIPEGSCFSQQRAYEMTGKRFGKWKARDCGCVEMADIGVYNSCLHRCRYCYANYDEKQIRDNFMQHDPESSLLIGHLEPGDEVTYRRR